MRSISRPLGRTVGLESHAAPSRLSRTDARRVPSVLTGPAEWVDEATQEDARATDSEPLRSRARTAARKESSDLPPDVGPERGVPGTPTFRQALRALQEAGTRCW